MRDKKEINKKSTEMREYYDIGPVRKREKIC